MSFEDLPREAFDSWNEVGLVYTRNKYGRIRSPPGYDLSRSNDCSFKNTLFKGPNCSVNTDDNTFNPQSLFFICLDYVAKNISMVESLEGFPDIVGEELFKKVHANEQFGSDPKNLKLFCEAYGGLVLSKLNLTSAHILISNYLEHLQLFVCLTELDISHCRLGDTHELLSYIAHLQGLTKLNLKENSLSDTGIRKLTLPQRLFKGGLGKLLILDLSLNPSITDDSIKHIAKLNSLTALNLSGTKITFGYGVPQLINQTNLCLALDVDDFKSGKAFTVTEGWAVDVVISWMEKSKTCTASNKSKIQVEKKSAKFYKSSRSVLKQKSVVKEKTITELPTIMLTSKKNKLACVNPSEMQQSVSKCMTGNKENSARNYPPKKKLKTNGNALAISSSSDQETLEDDFIKEYLNYDKQWKPVPGKCSLLESLDRVR